MKLPTQRKLNESLNYLAHRYNTSRAAREPGSLNDYSRGYYHGIDVATRELLHLFGVNLDEWDKLLDD